MKALFSRGMRRISLRLARAVLFTGLSTHPSLHEHLVSEGFIVWEGITSCPVTTLGLSTSKAEARMHMNNK